MQRVALLNGKNKNQDYDLSKIFESLAYPGVIDGLEVSENSVSAGAAFIQVSRNGKNFNILYTAEEAVIIDTSGTKKVWVRINQANVNNGITNNPTGTDIGVIEVGAEYPSTDSYISLADIVDGVITDVRQFVRGKGRVREDLPINSIIFIDSDGTEKYIEVDPTLDDGKSLIIDAINGLRLESPTLNINNLDQTTSLTSTDKFIVSTSGGNKSVEISDALRATYQKFTCGEAITKGDLVVQDTTNGKIYRWAGSLANKNIVGFAQANGAINAVILVVVSGIDGSKSGRVFNTDYYPDYTTFLADSTIVYQGQFNNQTSPFGVTFFSKESQILTEVKTLSANPTRAMLRNTSGNILATATISNQTAIFNYQLAANVSYQMVVDNNGGFFSAAYGSRTLPYNLTKINYTGYIQTNSPTLAEIKSITTASIAKGAISSTPNKFGIIGTGVSATEIIFQKSALAPYIIQGGSNGANGTSMTFTHGLGKIPKIVKMELYSSGTYLNSERPMSSGMYNGSTYATIAIAKYNISSSIRSIDLNFSDRIGYSMSANAGQNSSIGTIVTISDMNSDTITITNSATSNPLGYKFTLYVK